MSSEVAPTIAPIIIWQCCPCLYSAVAVHEHAMKACCICGCNCGEQIIDVQVVQDVVGLEQRPLTEQCEQSVCLVGLVSRCLCPEPSDGGSIQRLGAREDNEFVVAYSLIGVKSGHTGLNSGQNTTLAVF